MQKKSTKGKNKKAPIKGASKEIKREGIFNYDKEITNKIAPKKQKKIKRNSKDKISIGQAKKQKNNFSDKYIDVEEIPKISQKKLKKIRKNKKKEKKKKIKEIKKQVKIEEQNRKIRKKKLNSKQLAKRRKVKKVASFLSLVILILISITLFLLSPIFNINKIEVKQNKIISSEEIISLSKIEKGMNLFKISKKGTEENIKENPYIDSIKIVRNLPSTLEIDVVEREPSLTIQHGGAYAYIDSKGYILEFTDKKIEGKPDIQGYTTSEENIKLGNKLSEKDMERISEVLQILKSAENYSINNLITSVNISDNTNYVLYLQSENKTVNLGSIDKIDTKMIYLKSILEKEKDSSGIIFLDVDFKEKYPYMRFN